ncbi:methylenetetrahydrofolate reductase [Actinomycetospora cinnamomea]|uniref:5,10-methylenetetrahydrofolate reductase n=1 Tax=Actinomycetospora cinnamomea TaxID=663609 RepID=A0A2U1FQE4_9PSEU|nr:methylenetetrahydrofolate reductase [Actinomycetospora cinnamomea]PVZ14413.1 5,10-methylenetetrahydrofolate reductase [Actinomycetospora cinnamomea]
MTLDVPFDITAELDVPHRPDLAPIGRQLDALAPVAARFLVPDNATARAAVAGLVVAAEVRGRGHEVVAVLNARDRNTLGLHRDLLGLLALGVHEVLLLRGDRPEDEAEDGPLTVGAMLREARALAEEHGTALRVGVVAAPGRDLPRWKRDADVVWLAPTFSVPAVEEWRARHPDLGVPVRAGVLVPTGPRMARRVAEGMDLELPAGLTDALAEDGTAGVDAACEHALALRDAGVDGVHVVAVSRYREVAQRLAGAVGT